MIDEIRKVIIDLETDKQFLTHGVMKAQKACTEKCKMPNPSKKVLMERSWEQVEYSELLQKCQCMLSFVQMLKVSVSHSSRVLPGADLGKFLNNASTGNSINNWH